MKKKQAFWLAAITFLVLTIQLVAGASQLAYYDCEGNIDDNWNSWDAVSYTSNFSSYTPSGVLGTQSCYFDGSEQFNTDGGLDVYNDGITLSWWINTAQATTFRMYAAQGSIQMNRDGSGQADEKIRVNLPDDDSNALDGYLNTPDTWSNGSWNHHVIVFDGVNNNLTIYINGVQQVTTYTTQDTSDNWAAGSNREWSPNLWRLTGYLDEIKLYDGIVTSQEANNLYTCGQTSTCAAGGTNVHTVHVEDLFDDSNLAGVNVTFSGGFSNLTDASGNARAYGLSGTVNYNITKSGYYPSSGSVAVNTTDDNNITQAIYNITIRTIVTNVTVPNNFNISVGGKTYANGLNVYLRNGTNNLTFSKNTINETFYNLTFTVNLTSVPSSGSYEASGAYDLRINVTVMDANDIRLNENGTLNITESVNGFYKTLFIGNFSNTSTSFNVMRNYSYFLVANPYTYAAANGTVYVNGSDPTYTYQLNFNLYLARTFNLSFKDEITQELLNDTTFIVELISSIAAYNYTVTDGTQAYELLVPADYTIRYRSADRPERDYYEVITAESFHTINLYSLTSGNATDTLVTIVDTTGDEVENAVVQLLRYYVNCNCYEVVEMAKTSYAGVAYLVSEEVNGHYKFIVEYQNQTEFLSQEPDNFLADTITGQIVRTITINLGSDYYESFTSLTGVTSTTTYNEGTSTLSFIWNDPSSITTHGCLSAKYSEDARWKSIVNCSAGSSGSMLLTLNNYTNYQWAAYLKTSTTYSDLTVANGFINKVSDYDLGTVGSFASLFIIVGGAALFSFSAVAVVIFVGAVLFILIVLQTAAGFTILPLSVQFLGGFVALTVGISLYLLRK